MVQYPHMKLLSSWKNKEGGLSLIGIAVLVVIAIIVISYFGIDVQSEVEAPQTQSNLSYVWNGVVHFWDRYLEGPILYFWNNIFIALLWNGFVHNMLQLGNGQPPIDFSLDWLPPYTPPQQ